jgi:putative transposase
MGWTEHPWQDTEYVLQKFGEKIGAARKVYLAFVCEECVLGTQPELTGGGLIRSAGGWSEVLSMRQRGDCQFSDERILGSGEFVKDVIDEAEESIKERFPTPSGVAEAMKVLEQACHERRPQGLRFRCSLKHKDLYLKGYSSGAELYQ